MKDVSRIFAPFTICAVLALPSLVAAQTAPAIPLAISTPDKVETRIGTLEFKDGVPNAATVAKIYDNLDFTHAFEAFVNTMQGPSIAALRKGFQSVGVKDNEVLIFSELMDCQVAVPDGQRGHDLYVWASSTFPRGPWCSRSPPKLLGAIDDQWFRWVIDFGAPGADRGEGGNT